MLSGNTTSWCIGCADTGPNDSMSCCTSLSLRLGSIRCLHSFNPYMMRRVCVLPMISRGSWSSKSKKSLISLWSTKSPGTNLQITSYFWSYLWLFNKVSRRVRSRAICWATRNSWMWDGRSYTSGSFLSGGSEWGTTSIGSYRDLEVAGDLWLPIPGWL